MGLSRPEIEHFVDGTLFTGSAAKLRYRGTPNEEVEIKHPDNNSLSHDTASCIKEDYLFYTKSPWSMKARDILSC
jgi:hypothetical protein